MTGSSAMKFDPRSQRVALFGVSALMCLALAGCGSLSNRERLEKENDRLEKEIEENERKRRKMQDLLLDERRRDLERLREKYAGRSGTRIGDAFVVHSSRRTGETFSGDLLVVSVSGESAGWVTGDRAIVAGETITIEQAKLFVSDGGTLSHILPNDADSRIVLRADGGMNVDKGGTLILPLPFGAP